MVKKIDRKIVAYKVKTRDEPQDAPTPQDDVVHMHETVLRPERLMGTTYKLIRKVQGKHEHVHVVGLRGFGFADDKLIA